ncbi:MAG TPA: protease HtpX, partial [Ignisphaera aggregans]|nr:protease HtpX [Ignisphaera aggregans]
MRIMYPLARLKLSMIATLALMFSSTSLLLSVILSLVGNFGYMALVQILTLVTVFHIAQWLFAPYVIEALYRVRHVESSDPKYGWLVNVVSNLAKKSGIHKRIVVGVAKIDIPNAFAYESPLTGPRIAITERLLRIAPPNEIEAVIAHELGHIKHRDVVVMMIISLIPALLYWLGYTMLRMSAFYSLGER